MTIERRELLSILGELSTLCPDVRMGQWLLMFTDQCRDDSLTSLYDVEDEELLPVMRRFLETRREAAAEVAASG
jgi:hypothetical protein